MAKFSRRDLFRNATAGIGGALMLGPVAVSAGIEKGLPRPGRRRDPITRFEHGVASGDPLADRLIVWTRVTPDLERAPWLARIRFPVGYEVATDPGFRHLVRRGIALTSRLTDYTVKVDLVGLVPGRTYYYRFRTLDAESPSGRGRTLPAAGVERVKLAAMSCSNFPTGYFNVYRDVAGIDDLDAVLHLGDYIYEYGPGGYATENAEAIGRGFVDGNALELLKLADYRARYAQYRSDPDLQALHAAVPFITVWDDHEIANDAWTDGAENHDLATEGDFTRRKRAALRAWFEWMPVRPASRLDRRTIYRRFDYGDLLSLYMLDTRIIGRDRQLDFTNYLGLDGSFDGARFAADLGDPARTLLGDEQREWLQNNLLASPATWQVFGQQVLLGRMTVPAELILNLANPSPAILATFGELATIKARVLAGDPTVTPAERARVETVVPYNLDAWDGYAAERERLLGAAALAGKNLVVLAGDTHNAWANDLADLAGTPVGAEFATASVTSPGLEAFFGLPPALAPQAEQALELLIDGLRYSNISDRGYLTVTFTHAEATAEWTFVDNILSPDYARLDARGKRLRVRSGAGGRRIETA